MQILLLGLYLAIVAVAYGLVPGSRVETTNSPAVYHLANFLCIGPQYVIMVLAGPVYIWQAREADHTLSMGEAVAGGVLTGILASLFFTLIEVSFNFINAATGLGAPVQEKPLAFSITFAIHAGRGLLPALILSPLAQWFITRRGSSPPSEAVAR